jgi:hypothetical protein
MIAGKAFLLTGTNGNITNTLEFTYTIQVSDTIANTDLNINNKYDITLLDIQDTDGNNIDFSSIILVILPSICQALLAMGFGAWTSMMYLLMLLSPLTSLTPVSLTPSSLIEVSMCNAEVAGMPVWVASMRMVLPLLLRW